MADRSSYCFCVVSTGSGGPRRVTSHREPRAFTGTADQFARAMLDEVLSDDPRLAGDFVVINAWDTDRAGVFDPACTAGRAIHDPQEPVREAARERLRSQLPPWLPPSLTLPATPGALVLRTDFSDDAAWDAVCETSAAESPEGFAASLTFVSDPAFTGVTAGQAAALASESDRRFLFLCDRATVTDPEMPLVAVDLYDEPGRWFRVVPGRMWSAENNLSLANMAFRDFAGAVDPDGVFRGFQGEPR